MKKRLALTAMVLACSMPAFAGHDHEHGDKALQHDKMSQAMVDKHMKESDTNGDGMISLAEQEACAKKMFTKTDVNGDNMISKQEMIDMMGKEMADLHAIKEKESKTAETE